jgi:hypothetical protein
MAVSSTHCDYDSSLVQWSRARDVLAGEDAVKAAGVSYLPRLDSQAGAICQDPILELFRKGEILPGGRSNADEVALVRAGLAIRSAAGTKAAAEARNAQTGAEDGGEAVRS